MKGERKEGVFGYPPSIWPCLTITVGKLLNSVGSPYANWLYMYT